MDSERSIKPRVELAIVQMTSFCNIDCSYCYLAGRDQRNHLEPRTVTKIAERLFEYGEFVSPFHWQWHAGEPLAVGIDRFVRCQNALEEAFAPHHKAVNTSLQTNGILINAAWARLFAEKNIRVGVSIDGPKDIHDKKRRDRAGRGTHDAAVRGLNHLISAGVKPSVLCVVSPQSLNRGGEIIRFFGAAGVQHVAFNFEEREGENTSDVFADYPAHQLRAEVRQFVREVVATRREHYPSMRIREIDGFHQNLVTSFAHLDLSSKPFHILTINTRGEVMTFSPELAGASRRTGSPFSFGNLFEEDLLRILDRVLQSEEYDAIKRGVEMCRKDCTYYSICRGGSPGNKFFENGTFASTETSYCRMRYQYLVDGMLDLLLEEDSVLKSHGSIRDSNGKLAADFPSV